MNRFRAAVVGCGRIASLFANEKARGSVATHAQAYLKFPQTDLIAACDIDEAKLRAFGKVWGVKNLYSDVDSLLDREEIDFLSICTWNKSHLDIVEKAVKKGVKGIMCEKPIADSLENADKMISLCKKYEVPLLVNYTRRYVPSYAKIKRMIERGDLGRIQNISCYYTSGVMNTGTHLFDLLRYFFGDVEWVWADPDSLLGGEDKTFNGYLFFEQGFGCSLTALDAKHYLMFETDIYGTKKRLRFTDSGYLAHLWNIKKHHRYAGYQELNKMKILEFRLDRALLNAVESLVKISQHKRVDGYCSGDDARASLEIAAALHFSADQGGARVTLPLTSIHQSFGAR